MKSTWLITSKLANQRARKALFNCVVYTNNIYCDNKTNCFLLFQYLQHQIEFTQNNTIQLKIVKNKTNKSEKKGRGLACTLCNDIDSARIACLQC